MKKPCFIPVLVCIALTSKPQVTVRIADINSFINFKNNAPWITDRFDGNRLTIFSDVNGDGKADAVAVFDNRIMVRLSDGKTFLDFLRNKSWTSSSFVGTKGNFFADVNGDGKADAIAVFDNRVMVRLSDGAKFVDFAGNKSWTSSSFVGTKGNFFADVNGDGKADAIAIKDNGIQVRLSDGNKFIDFSGNKPWTLEPYFGTRGTYFADATGDGKADAIVVNDDGVTLRRSDGSKFLPNESWTSEPYFGTKGTWFADVNGDGKADAIVVNDDLVTVRISDGSKFLPNASWTRHPFYGIRGTYFADVNGDGKNDILALGGNPVNANQPFNIQGIEIVQSIQEIHNFVPLIAGKTTMVRVYIKTGSDENFSFKGRLQIQNLTDGNSIIIPTAQSLTPDAGFDDDLEHKRNNLNQSLNFIIPADFNTEGNCSFELLDMTDQLTKLGLICGDCKTNTTSAIFIKSPRLQLRVVGIQYISTIPKASGTFSPSAKDFAFVQSWIPRAYPVAQINTSQTMIITSNDWPFDCGDANCQLAALRCVDIDNGIAGKKTHYISLVSDGGGFMRGCACRPGYVGSSPAGPLFGSDFDGSYADWYGAHELAHNLNRQHPGFCDDNSKDDDAYPYPNGQITNEANKFIGLDVGDAANSIPVNIIPGTGFDVMTYCDQPLWLSNYTYVHILHWLQDETAEENSTNSSNGQQGQFLSITGTINLSKQTGKIQYINKVHRVFINKNDDTLQARIVLRAKDNAILKSYSVPLQVFSDVDSTREKKALLDAIIPFQNGIASVEFMYNKKLIDKITVSKRQPVVSNPVVSSREAGTEKNGMLIKWQGSDADSKVLRYMVQLRSKEGFWETIALAIKESQIILTVDQLKNNTQSVIRIIANDGFNSSNPVELKLY